MSSYGQNNEDLFIAKYFTTPGFYVDVGAFDGKTFSNTYLLEQQGWKGICVEPHPHVFKQLRDNRPGATCVEAACVALFPETTVTLRVPNNTPVLGTLSKSDTAGIANILTTQPANIFYTDFQVKARLLDDILREHAVQAEFELLSIDTEWTESDVLMGTDLYLWQPEMLMVECNTGQELQRIKGAIQRRARNIHYLYIGRIAVNHIWLRGDCGRVQAAKELLKCHSLR